MTEFYHIFIEPKEGVSHDDVKKKMDLAVDWFRCTNNVWVVYTTSDEDKWMERLLPLVNPKGSLFICRLDLQRRNGFMTKKFWEWIEKNTKSGY